MIDIDLLSLNLPPLTLTFILRACFNDEKIILINDENTITTHLENFFYYMFQDSFKIEISMMPIDYYKKYKNQFKNHVVIVKDTIVKDNTNLLNLKQMKIEKAIVQKYIGDSNPKVSLIIVKNEIKKAFNLAKEIIIMNELLKENEV